MTLPAIKFTRLRLGPNTAPTPGQDDDGDGGFAALVPVAEPISAGAWPSGVGDPRVERIRAAWPQRRANCAANRRSSHPTDTAARPVFTLRWRGLRIAERDALMVFLRSGTSHGALGATLYPDGRDGSAVTVRVLGATARPSEDRQVAGTGFARGREAIFGVAVEAEEVLT